MPKIKVKGQTVQTGNKRAEFV